MLLAVFVIGAVGPVALGPCEPLIARSQPTEMKECLAKVPGPFGMCQRRAYVLAANLSHRLPSWNYYNSSLGSQLGSQRSQAPWVSNWKGK